MKKIGRKSFIEKGLKLGISLLAGTSFVIPGLFKKKTLRAKSKADISVVSGKDFYKCTIKAIKNLGGINQFISKGDTVGLLINSSFKNPGTYTKPDIVIAIARLCFEAGAKEVRLLKDESLSYFKRSQIYKKHRTLVKILKSMDSDHSTMKVPKAKNLKEMNIYEDLLEHDVLINLPILKHHNGTNFTCNLKNMMGVTNFSTNMKFHFGPNYAVGAIKEMGDWYANVDHLSQCIADLNTVRKADLCIVDASAILTENGPSGPGKIKKINKVIAGKDPVAVDSYCCRFLGLKPQNVAMIKKAYEHKIGEMNVSKLKILEKKL
jgi:uncharacterized protein (DUF362 family)